MEVLYKKTLHRVSLAVRLIDDFTGKPLNGSGYRFYINDVHVHPIRKAEGYFVITDIQWDAYCLKITSPWYCTNEIYIGAGGHEKVNSPFDIRLYPGCAYPMLSGLTLYCGIFSSTHLNRMEGISVRLMADLAGGRIKLKNTGKAAKPAADLEDGRVKPESTGKEDEQSEVSTITLQNPDGKDLTGTTIAFGSGESDSPMEIVVLKRRLEGNAYETGTRLQKSYPSGTPLFRVYRSLTDNRGKVLIPVEGGTQPELDVMMEAAYGENKISGKRLLKTGTATTYHEVI